jgi:hypothetical protein
MPAIRIGAIRRRRAIMPIHVVMVSVPGGIVMVGAIVAMMVMALMSMIMALMRMAAVPRIGGGRLE